MIIKPDNLQGAQRYRGLVVLFLVSFLNYIFIDVAMCDPVDDVETSMLTCPCNVYPLTPHFYIVKLGSTGVYIFFIFLL